MDTPDWTKLTNLAEQYGHGAVKFLGEDGEEFDVLSVEFEQESEEIVVQLG